MLDFFLSSIEKIDRLLIFIVFYSFVMSDSPHQKDHLFETKIMIKCVLRRCIKNIKNNGKHYDIS